MCAAEWVECGAEGFGCVMWGAKCVACGAEGFECVMCYKCCVLTIKRVVCCVL